jgi:hypothetical protein
VDRGADAAAEVRADDHCEQSSAPAVQQGRSRRSAGDGATAERYAGGGGIVGGES